MISESQHVVREVATRYGVDPSSVRAVFAPYRICPLGAHIDHQLGPVSAMALDKGILLAYAPSSNREVRVSSMNFPGEIQFDLDDTRVAHPGDWGNYIRGAVRSLAHTGYMIERGIVGVVAGRRFSEGGLSSSAAVGVAYLLALEDVNNLEVTPKENILLDQAIENRYLGLHNGILDQAAILVSRKNQLAVINCADATHELITPPPTMPSWNVIIAYSGVKQALVGTGYNRRVAECAAAARILLKAVGRQTDHPLLGQVTASEYAEHRDKLPAALGRRAAHFFGEVERVRNGAEAWKRGDLQHFGRLMIASGESSIMNYECGSEPMINLHHILCQREGIYGARFSGAGFRGCCIGLVATEAAAQVCVEVEREYNLFHPALATHSQVIICNSGDGARILQPSDLVDPRELSA